MDVDTINSTILAHQPSRLTEESQAEALAAAALCRDRSLDGQRLAAACALSDRWPMSVCVEIARALLPGPAPEPLRN